MFQKILVKNALTTETHVTYMNNFDIKENMTVTWLMSMHSIFNFILLYVYDKLKN